MKIIMLGYMASGKSTVGKLLATRLCLPFIDLDRYIEEEEGRSISEIFKEEGEIQFRLKEHQYLKQLLLKEEDFVLSLGGGTPCYAGNMNLVLEAKETTSVYLRASINTIVKRLQAQRNKRPLVASLSDEQLTEFVAKHLFERRYFYEQANLKLTIGDGDVEEIVNQLQSLLY